MLVYANVYILLHMHLLGLDCIALLTLHLAMLPFELDLIGLYILLVFIFLVPGSFVVVALHYRQG